MAIPVIESFSICTIEGSQTQDTVFPTAPSGITAGDLILVIAISENINSNDFGGLTGYTQINGPDNVDDVQLTYYWREATGDANDGFPDLTFSTPSGDYKVAWALRISGVNTADPFDLTPTFQIGKSDGFTISGLTTTVDDVLAIYVVGTDGSDVYPFSTTGTGWTIATGAEQEPDNSASGVGGEWGQKDIITAGGTEDVAVSYAISESEGWIGAILTINPTAATRNRFIVTG